MSDKIISFEVTNSEYEEIKCHALFEGKDISTYSKTKVLDYDSESGKYYKLLLEKVNRLPHSSVHKFTLRDLLENEEWYQTATIGIKLAIGRRFYYRVKNKLIKDVEAFDEYKPGKSIRYMKHEPTTSAKGGGSDTVRC